MHMKEIVLDGFKSYGHRTVIAGFDNEFNAITGLNGSGIPNMLDSICFVLGISNLNQVGAGCSTVSITFDNGNKAQSPPGFEDYHEITVTRQVVMGGKSQYMLNGSVVQNERIQDLFSSVQLNSVNSYFLITQFRIAAVLNMTPPEILAVVEVLANTRWYVTHREAAQKTIGKMEAKLLEYDKIIQEEITPKLDKLREERTAYLEYQRMEREVQSIEDSIETNNQKTVEIDTEVEAMTQTIQSVGDKLVNLEVELDARVKSAAVAAASENSAKQNIAAEKREKKRLQRGVKDDQRDLKSKEQELGKVQGLFQQLRDTDEADNRAFELSQKKYGVACIGMEINDDGEAQTLQEQLMNAQQLASEANTTIKIATKQLEFLQTYLKDKQSQTGTNALEYEKNKRYLESKENKVWLLEKSLHNLSYSEEQMNKLKGHRVRLRNEIRTLQERSQSFHLDYLRTKSNSKRMLYRLITLKDRTTATAIETVAGRRLYNVIVAEGETSKWALQRGNLETPTTFTPLNEVREDKFELDIVKFAQDLVGKENVQSALSLINYDEHLQPVMKSIFGDVFICKDVIVASQLINRINRRCVTLNGDEIETFGIITGGAPPESILLQLEEITEHEKQLKLKEEDFIEVENQILQMSGVQEQWNHMTQEFELNQHELELIRQRLHHTTHHMLLEEIHTIEQEMGEWMEKMVSSKKIETENNKKVEKLEVIMKDAKGYRERLYKGAEEEMKRLKKKADSSRKNWKQREPEYDILNIEILVLRKELKKLKQEIIASEETLKSSLKKFKKRKNEAVKQKRLASELQQQYKAEKASIREKEKYVQKINHHKEQLLAQITEFQLEIMKLGYEIKKLQHKFNTCKHKEAEYGKEEYDNKHLKEAQELGDNNAKELEEKIRNFKEQRTKLSRTVSRATAQSMFEHEEKRYNRLLMKKRSLESDKRNLIQLMTDLDEAKVDAIMSAWHQLSKNFGAICGTLLHGSIAKLQAPKGQTVLDGLEVKIFLGGVWKESLSELSGGQRSLVALSLLLAMLQRY